MLLFSGSICFSGTMSEERLVKIWDEIKAIMRKRFVLNQYYRELY
jgi:hypothetical protein